MQVSQYLETVGHMKRALLGFFCIIFISFCSYTGYGQEYEKFQIKLGMHERAVNEKYGTPIMTENLKRSFLWISRKRALYKIADSDYMILYFFSGRVKDVTILEDIEHDEALLKFKE